MADDFDMFDKLADELIIFIVSFLNFKEAARTSVLAKRWRYAWHGARNIEFNENFFFRNGGTEENKDAQRRGFVEFARRWIGNYRGDDINRFELSITKPGDFHADMQTLISLAVARNVKVLGLDFSDPSWVETSSRVYGPKFDLPSVVYSLDALESLKLYCCSFDARHFKNFSLIKDISLGWIRLTLPVLTELLRSFPLLENLSLKKCWNLDYIDISLPNSRLHSIVLDKCCIKTDYITIEAPNLRFLKYSGRLPQFEFEGKPFIDEVDLDFGLETEIGDAGEADLLAMFLYQTFPINVLTVCSYLLQVLPHGEEPVQLKPPMEVTHLVLKIAMDVEEFEGIRLLIRSSPRLQIITFQIEKAKNWNYDYGELPRYSFVPKEFWTKQFRIETCVLKTLREINVRGFRGTLHEQNMIRYLLYYGRVLRRLNIYVSRETNSNGEGYESHLRKAQCMLTYTTTSRNLKISIV